MSEHDCTDTQATNLAVLLTEASGLSYVEFGPLWEYACLAVVLHCPANRALTYLQEYSNSPEHAQGRLLLWAAERALREAGELK